MKKKFVCVLLAGILAVTRCGSVNAGKDTAAERSGSESENVESAVENGTVLDSEGWKQLFAQENQDAKEWVYRKYSIFVKERAELDKDELNEPKADRDSLLDIPFNEGTLDRWDAIGSEYKEQGVQIIPYLLSFALESDYPFGGEEYEAVYAANRLAGIDGFVGYYDCEIKYCRDCEYEVTSAKYYAYQLKGYLLGEPEVDPKPEGFADSQKTEENSDTPDWTAVFEADDPYKKEQIFLMLQFAEPSNSWSSVSPFPEKDMASFYENSIAPLGYEAVPYLISYIEESEFDRTSEDLALYCVYRLAGVDGYVGRGGEGAVPCEYEEPSQEYYAYQLKEYLLHL